jgi:hypothetical protein
MTRRGVGEGGVREGERGREVLEVAAAKMRRRRDGKRRAMRDGDAEALHRRRRRQAAM